MRVLFYLFCVKGACGECYSPFSWRICFSASSARRSACFLASSTNFVLAAFAAILATGFEVSDLTFKGENGGDADEHIAQSQYIVLKPDQLDDNDLLEKLDKTPAYDRPKDFRDNFDGSEKKEESNGSGRRTIRF